MRKSMNLKSLIEGKFCLGDEVEVGADGEEKRKGIVKVPHAPSNTTGVLVDGELEMAPQHEVHRERTDERTDLERARRAMQDSKGTPAHKELADRYEKLKADRERTDEDGMDGLDGETDVDADSEITEDDEDGLDVLEESVLGMTTMPSLLRLQQLAGIRTEAAEAPAFLQKDDEDGEDDQAEETEAEPTVDAEPEAEADEEAEEGEAEPVGGEEEVAIVAADDEPTDAVVQAAQDMENAVEAQPTKELAPNHPATAGEVTMMSVQTPQSEAEPQPEPEAAPDPIDVCMKAISDLEAQLPNVSVKDFASINKRLTAIQSGLLEGYTGRRRKVVEGAEIEYYTIEPKDTPHGEKFAVYGWGTYPSHSVLAGQQMKKFINWFDTPEEAREAYPQAEDEVGYRSANNTFSHLPGEDDPVPGGMYPDDY